MLNSNCQDATAQMLSVNGFSIKSNFSIHTRIKIENRGMFGTKVEEHSRDFPIFIRSKTIRGEPICDVQQLGLLPNTLQYNVKKLETYFGYVDNPYILPGCTTAYESLKITREFI